MNKAGEKRVERAIVKKRSQLSALRDEIDDLFDYLDILEARARDLGKPRLTHEQVKKRYAVKSVNPRSRNGRGVAA
jgi:hypothetical protein